MHHSGATIRRAHVHAQAWLDAGFEAKDVDCKARRVTFQRVRANLARRLDSLKAFRQSAPTIPAPDVTALIREDRER